MVAFFVRLVVAQAAGEARARRMDVQHPQFAVADVAKAVGDAKGCSNVGARPSAHDLVADHELRLAFDHVEGINLVRMTM